MRSLQQAREAVDQCPNNDAAWFSLGMSLLKTTSLTENDLAKAGHALRKSIAIREQ